MAEPHLPALFFTHGNGFPNACYQQLFSQLEAHDFVIKTTPMLGHDPSYPITDNWSCLADELIAAIEQRHDSAVIGIGHSFGGVVTLLASYKRPELFQQVIMLDSPTLLPKKAFLVKWIKRLGLMDLVTPSGRTKNRKTQWQSREEAYDYFKTKPLFQDFDERCLQDYIDHGLRETTGGQVTLLFEQPREYHIFHTLPTNVFQGRTEMPVTTHLIYGSNSNVVSHADARFMSHNYGIGTAAIQGGHMFPFESPEKTALCIKEHSCLV